MYCPNGDYYGTGYCGNPPGPFTSELSIDSTTVSELPQGNLTDMVALSTGGYGGGGFGHVGYGQIAQLQLQIGGTTCKTDIGPNPNPTTITIRTDSGTPPAGNISPASNGVRYAPINGTLWGNPLAAFRFSGSIDYGDYGILALNEVTFHDTVSPSTTIPLPILYVIDASENGSVLATLDNPVADGNGYDYQWNAWNELKVSSDMSTVIYVSGDVSAATSSIGSTHSISIANVTGTMAGIQVILNNPAGNLMTVVASSTAQ